MTHNSSHHSQISELLTPRVHANRCKEGPDHIIAAGNPSSAGICRFYFCQNPPFILPAIATKLLSGTGNVHLS